MNEFEKEFAKHKDNKFAKFTETMFNTVTFVGFLCFLFFTPIGYSVLSAVSKVWLWVWLLSPLPL